MVITTSCESDADRIPAPESNEHSPDKDLMTPDKAKLRRAQVRRAQIQHRQRKAEYVKQLELDASHYRELISFIEFETKGLRSQNVTMKAQLQGLGVPLPTTQNQSQLEQSYEANPGIDSTLNTYLPPETQLASTEPTQPQPFSDIIPTYQPLPKTEPEASEMFGDINIDDFTVTLKNDHNLGTPVFEISSSSASSSHDSPSTAMTETRLTPEQELTVMNFILAYVLSTLSFLDVQKKLMSSIVWSMFAGTISSSAILSDTNMNQILPWATP